MPDMLIAIIAHSTTSVANLPTKSSLNYQIEMIVMVLVPPIQLIL
jgi:hypothetical protein